MDAELVKAPVPIERLAAKLRAIRQDLGGQRGQEAASLAVAYDAKLVELAAMVEADLPARRCFAPGRGGGYHFDPPSRARAEVALARAGVDVGGPRP